MKRFLCALLTVAALCLCATALADGLDFYHQALSVRNAQEMEALAKKYGVILHEAEGQHNVFLCDGLSIAGVPVAKSDVIVPDNYPSMPLVLFAYDESVDAVPGEPYETLLKALTARYGEPSAQNSRIVNTHALWLFDGIVVRLDYIFQTDDQPSYVALEYSRNKPGIGHPPIPEESPSKSDVKKSSAGLTIDEYTARLTAAAEIAGLSFGPMYTVIEVGDYTYYQTEYDDIAFNIATETSTGRVVSMTLPITEGPSSALAICALSRNETAMRTLTKPLTDVGKEDIDAAMAQWNNDVVVYKNPPFTYEYGQDRNTGRYVLMISLD